MSYILPEAVQESLTGVNEMSPSSYAEQQITCLHLRDKWSQHILAGLSSS